MLAYEMRDEDAWITNKVNLGKFKNTFHLAVYKVTFCYMHKW